MKNLKLLAMISLLTISLTACNTVEGAGEDIQTLGSGIENTANENK